MSVFGTRVTNPSQQLQTFQTIPYKLMRLHILQIKSLQFFFPKNFPIQKKKVHNLFDKMPHRNKQTLFCIFPIPVLRQSIDAASILHFKPYLVDSHYTSWVVPARPPVHHREAKNETKDKGVRFAQSFIAFGDPSIKGTNVGKKRGRGKAKGINAGDGEIEVEIYDGKIITPKATREITILFHQKLNGAWTNFTEYPNSELETLYARYRAQRFKHKQPDEEVKKAFVESVKHRYSDWMFRIRNPIFQKYEKKEDRYKNGPSFIPTTFWKEMVDKWMVKDWGETSLTNKGNRNKSKIFSTTGSVPMAKYRYEMYLETGSEPSPIDCFKKFHTKNNGKEWATDHAKTLYEKMDAIKAKAVSEGTKTNDYQIFREVVGEPSHGRILGMGIGIKAKDVYGLTSSGKGCSKRCREDFTKEKEDLEARLREEMDSKLAKVVEKLEEKFAQKLQSMGIPQQSDIDPATTDGTSRDEEHNSNNNIEVENNLESDSEED